MHLLAEPATFLELINQPNLSFHLKELLSVAPNKNWNIKIHEDQCGLGLVFCPLVFYLPIAHRLLLRNRAAGHV